MKNRFALNETHDPERRSWVSSANGRDTDFPIQNLAFGVFRRRNSGEAFRGGVAIGDAILDVSAVASLFREGAKTAAEACGNPTLFELAALDRSIRSELRLAISDLLDRRNEGVVQSVAGNIVAQIDAEMSLPFRIAGFTDFFASIFHATNVGRMFRPEQPLLPNYKFVPIAYNGRTSTFRVSGAAVRRPRGQIKKPDLAIPERIPTRALDYEAELGVYIATPSETGEPVAVATAHEHVFGFSLLNDWSARDIQAWEYQPLGPFLAKSFATSVGPWVVTEEALRPFRVHSFVRPDGDPAPLPYLDDPVDRASGGLDITLQVFIRSAEMARRGMRPVQLSQSSTAHLYWTTSQMIAHQTSNGCNLQTGELIGSGTVSGAEVGSFGSLIEITRRGDAPLALPTGETRVFLEDGDEVSFSGFCDRPGFVRIGFGGCTGAILPAPEPEDIPTSVLVANAGDRTRAE